MNRTEKGDIVAGLTDRFSRAASIYVTDFTGLRVKNMTELRRRLRAAGGEYVVVKNTLALRALQAAAPRFSLARARGGVVRNGAAVGAGGVPGGGGGWVAGWGGGGGVAPPPARR